MKNIAGIAVYLGAVALTLGVVSPIIKNAKREDEYLKRQFNKSLSEGKISVTSEES